MPQSWLQGYRDSAQLARLPETGPSAVKAAGRAFDELDGKSKHAFSRKQVPATRLLRVISASGAAALPGSLRRPWRQDITLLLIHFIASPF